MICYLDNSSTTRPLDEVLDYMHQLQKDCYGNPSSLHTLGIKAENALKLARDRISSVLKISPKEIVFTSGATESNNLAIKGFLSRNKRYGNHIITTKMEHPSVLRVIESLSQQDYQVSYVDINKDGIINLDSLESLLNDETALVSIMHINNETGAIQPIHKIKALMHKKGSKGALHVDAVQSFCKVEILPVKWGIDLLTISSHKIHGPKGAGALYISPSIKLNSILEGGAQEIGLRAGTENVPAFCAFGLAVEICNKRLEYSKIVSLRRILLSMLKSYGVNFVNNSIESGSPYIINLSFPGIRSEVLLHHLEMEEVFVSTGSACANRKSLKSSSLSAMGKSAEIIDSAIRISFGYFNDEEQVDNAANVIAQMTKILGRKK